jgi:hypothetical protein
MNRKVDRVDNALLKSTKLKPQPPEKYMRELDRDRFLTTAYRELRKLRANDPKIAEWQDGDIVPVNIAGIISMWAAQRLLGTNELVDIEKLNTLSQSYLIPSPEIVACWEAWQHSKHIYRFDETLAEELKSQELNEELPLEVLSRLPYPCMYIACPTIRTTMIGDEHIVDGFFVFRSTITYSVDFNNAPQLVIVYLKNGRGTAYELSLNHKTMTGVLDEQMKLDLTGEDKIIGSTYDANTDEIIERITIRDYCEKHRMTFTKYKEQYRNEFKRQIAGFLNLILYIVAENSEQEIIYRPAQGNYRTNPKKPKSEATMHKVGVRIGAALRAASIRYENGTIVGDKGAGTKAPHMRRGHYHHFWKGPRKGKRELIVHWIPPIGINIDNDDETLPTIHDVSLIQRSSKGKT